MHHKYDIGLKDAFYIIDLAAGSLFILIILTFPSYQAQFTISFGRWKTEPDEKEK